MSLPFYNKNSENSSKIANISENIPISEKIGIKAKTSERNIEKSMFLKDLLLHEKGQLTAMGELGSNTFSIMEAGPDKNIITHRLPPNIPIPWILYRLCYQNVPIVYNSINNTADFAMQAGFELDSSNDAKEKILKWFDDVNFELIMHNILKQMQIFGNAYLDISDLKFPKLLQPDNMFVMVQKGGNEDGKVVGYKQKISMSDAKNITFEPEELIHFKWNDATSTFYGMSEIHPALGSITRYENWKLDLGAILHRYAAPTIQWKIGSDEFPATQAQIDDYKAALEQRLTGEDMVTSAAINAEVIGAGQKMMQVDGLVTSLQNEIIAAMRIPEIFARGGESSNKATADIELQAFDRKVRALQKTLSMLLEDYLFPKITKGKVRMTWNEFSAEGELIRAQRIQAFTSSQVPIQLALKMVGLGNWVDDLEKLKAEEEKKMQEQNEMQKQNIMAQNPQNGNNPNNGAPQNKNNFSKPPPAKE